MKHWCHCFSRVSIFFTLLCKLSRMLFPRSYMTGNFQLVSLRQVFRNVGNSFVQGSELKDRFRIFPILMETPEQKTTGVQGF